MPDSLDDFEKLLQKAPYEKEEIRHGVPLGYVGEKLESSLMSLHFTWRIMNDSIPANLPNPLGAPEGYDEKVALISAAFQSFRNGVKAYTSLYNWLQIIDNEEYYQSLLDKDHAAFKRWLDLVASRGNVLDNQ